MAIKNSFLKLLVSQNYFACDEHDQPFSDKTRFSQSSDSKPPALLIKPRPVLISHNENERLILTLYKTSYSALTKSNMILPFLDLVPWYVNTAII